MNEPGKIALNFTSSLSKSCEETIVTDRENKPLTLSEGFVRTLSVIEECSMQNKKLLFIGNGGSASIANHQAIDFWHNGKVRATSFSDSSMLTCLSNDYGYDKVFSKPISSFAEEKDILLAISSSGKSKNILNGVEAARNKRCFIITFSGFHKQNPLRMRGDLNFYVPSESYGIVEVTHLALIHGLLEDRMKSLKGSKI